MMSQMVAVSLGRARRPGASAAINGLPPAGTRGTSKARQILCVEEFVSLTARRGQVLTEAKHLPKRDNTGVSAAHVSIAPAY
jgi:hypothetical protein